MICFKYVLKKMKNHNELCLLAQAVSKDTILFPKS